MSTFENTAQYSLCKLKGLDLHNTVKHIYRNLAMGIPYFVYSLFCTQPLKYIMKRIWNSQFKINAGISTTTQRLQQP